MKFFEIISTRGNKYFINVNMVQFISIGDSRPTTIIHIQRGNLPTNFETEESYDKVCEKIKNAT
jgi:hypothetical protein